MPTIYLNNLASPAPFREAPYGSKRTGVAALKTREAGLQVLEPDLKEAALFAADAMGFQSTLVCKSLEIIVLVR